MCCFTFPVRGVHGTFVFVAPVAGNRQVVVYFNHVEVGDVPKEGPQPAMILPFPTRPGKKVRGVFYAKVFLTCFCFVSGPAA